MFSIATLFSGGGILEARLKDIGVKPIWGVEADPRIAELYRLNYPDSNLVCEIASASAKQRVENIQNWAKLEKPDIIHASPPCIRFSLANHLGKESDEDRNMALAIVSCITALKPQFVTLENVVNYYQAYSYNDILNCLYTLGYWVEDFIVNFSHYGIPQNRVRLFLIAWKDNRLVLPAKKQHSGWYSAIADLIPTFEPDKLTGTQKKRLQDKGLDTYLQPESQKELLPILIKRVQIRKHLASPTPEKPVFTITSKICTDHRKNNRNKFINLINSQGIFNLTTRALARLQTVPDSYQLIGKSGIDGVAIGNGLPSLFYANLLKQLI